MHDNKESEFSSLYSLRALWRVGRKVGRTVYAMVGDEASDDDWLIGVFDTTELAMEVVRAHNFLVELRRSAP